MNVSGEIFMPENSRNEDESLTAEGQLFSCICSRTGRSYDLTEYVNDTNRQYVETLTAYTVNSGATESYSYAGNRRLSREQRLDIARCVYDGELTVEEAVKYELNPSSVKGYLRLYRAKTGLSPTTCRKKTRNVTQPVEEPKDSSLKEYESMSKEESGME